MKIVLRCLPLLAAVLLVACCAGQKAAVTGTPLSATGEYVQKVENFLVIFDRTGSMADSYDAKVKFWTEKFLVSKMNGTIPNFKLASAIRTLGDNRVDFGVTQLVYGLKPYDRQEFQTALNKISLPTGETPLNKAIDASTADLKSAAGRIAVIIFSDGQDMDRSPVISAENMKKAYGDRICIYTVQIGGSLAGKKILEDIAKAGRCGFATTADRIASDAGMADFVQKVFFEKAAVKPAVPAEVQPAPAPPEEAQKKAPAAAAAPAPEKARITLDVKFDTNKAVVKPKYQDEIKKVAAVMKKNPQTMITIEGHTDFTGSSAENKTLSQNRANAVKTLLVREFGIEPDRIKAVGYGEDKPIADNKTAAGREQNRRVVAEIEYWIKK